MHERDYLERTIATVRNHRGADNCWPQWANIFADEIERLWQRLEQAETRLSHAATGLALIQDGPVGLSDVSPCTGWCAGVAMSALAAMDEVGYPKPCPIPAFADDPYTVGMALCDPSGIVTSYREGEQVQFPCTGHAHLYGEHIECTSPAHTSARSPV